jgi:GPH family glycoside/pentoside/hexuronide:cation symporter
LTASPASRGRLLAYGAPTFALSYLLFFVQFYFLKFATDVLLLSPALVGLVFGIARLWDAVADPLVGSWSDRSRSRFGRRRPFLLAALPLLALGFVPLWRPPAALSGPALIVWVSVALFVFYTAFTLYTLPHVALGAELSRDSHERTRLFAARQMSFTVGILLAFGAIQVAMTAAAPRAMAARLAVPGVLVACAILVITPLLVREPPAAGRRGGRGLVPGLRDVLGGRPARLLLAVWAVESVGLGAVGTMAPYVAEYVLRRPDVVGTLPAAYVVSAVLTIPVWVRVSRRFGKRLTWLGAMLLAAAAFGGMFFVGPGDVIVIIALLVVAGSSMGCGSVLSVSILADVIDLDEHRTGERKEGVFSAAMTLVQKAGTSLSTVASGMVLAAVGFVPNVAQSADSLLGIRALFAGLPCLGFLVGAWIFSRVPLEAPRGASAPASGEAAVKAP